VERPDRWTLAAFAGAVLIGGLNALAVRFQNVEVPPLWGAGARFGIAGLLFAVALVALRLPRPRGAALTGALVFGVLTFGLGYALVYWALVHVKAGMTMVILSIVPLVTLLLALAHGVEKFRWRAMAGAVLAAGGIAVVFREQLGSAVPPLALAALLGTAFCWSEASVLLKRFPGAHPVAVNTLGMIVGAAMLLVFSALRGELRVIPQLRATWLAFAYLVVVGSLVLFVLYLVVLQRWTASGASYQFLLLPLVSLTASAWVDAEPLTPSLAVGGALVLAGVYVGAFARARPAAAAAPEPTATEPAP
jgi:drug/metabolite transporter (DMT)-like permease